MKTVFQHTTAQKQEKSPLLILAAVAALLLVMSITAYRAIPHMVGSTGTSLTATDEQETIYKTSERSWHGLGLGLFGGLRR